MFASSSDDSSYGDDSDRVSTLERQLADAEERARGLESQLADETSERQRLEQRVRELESGSSSTPLYIYTIHMYPFYYHLLTFSN